jgi:hypothetical protein
MSYSRRQLYAMGETFGESATRREVGGRIIYGGGSSPSTPANTTQQITQELPAWARPYAKESLAKASALADSPYQTYGGERIAQFSPLQQGAFGRAEGQQVAGQIGFGSGLAGLAGTSSFGDQGTAASFMSPYMQQVVDQQMESAQRQADIASTQRGAQAVRAGAFGGSRQAVEDAEAARALASQKGQIQATGLQSAFERAQSQFNQEQATRINAAQALGQLGGQQFGQEMDITGQQAQFGAQQRAATQDILSQQYQDFLNQQRAPYDQLAFMTSMIRGTPMGGTTAQYQYQAPPSALSQGIGLVTAGAGAYGAYQGGQNNQGVPGSAAGGEVKSYAAGGIASLSQPEIAAMADGMSDQQLGQTAQMPSITDLARMTLAAEAQQRAQMRQAAMQQQAMMAQQPQGTVAEEQMAAIDAMDQGLGGLDVPDDLVGDEYTAAGGGIVAFQAGGAAYVTPYDRYGQRKFAEEEARRREFQAYTEQLRNDPGQIALREAQQGGGEQTPGQRSAARGQAIRAFFDDTLTTAPTAAMAQIPTLAQPVAAPARVTAGVDGSDNRFQRGPSVAGITNQPAAAPAGTQTAARSSGAAPTATTAAPAGIAALLPKNLQALQAQYRGEVEAAGKAGEQIEADRLAAIKRDQEEMPEIGAKREKLLKAQEKALEGAEKKNFNMALIEAGLAIMSGDSANAFENIGKGAMVGTKAYTMGMERIQNRKEKLDESLMALDELRYGDKKASKKELRDAEAAVNKAKQQTATALAAVTGKEADVAVDMYTKQLDRQATLTAASMRAATTGTSKAVKDAEAAFARDPQALALKKQLENPVIAGNRTKRETAENQLRLIRADKYRQFGATLETDTAGATGSDSDPLGIL